MAEKIENSTDAENRAVSRAELRADPCADAGALTRAKCGIFATTALGLCHIDTLMALYEKNGTDAETGAVFRAEKIAPMQIIRRGVRKNGTDAVANRYAVCRANSFADVRAEHRAVIRADGCADENGTDAVRFAGADFLCCLLSSG